MKFGKSYFEEAFEKDEISDAEKEIRGEDLEQVEEDTPTEPVEKPTAEVDKPEEVEKPTEPEKPTEEVQKIVIDGEELTVDQIRELKKGNMRQSDYTKKTQELAEQRKEVETLRSNLENSPEADKVAMKEKLGKLEYELANKELDTELSALKQKYPDFDENKVLIEANKRGMTGDFEFIYKALREDKVETVDAEAIKKQAIEEYKEKISKELQADKDKTTGSIISSEPGVTPIDYTNMLTNEEKAYCIKRGITEKSYVEMRDAEYKI